MKLWPSDHRGTRQSTYEVNHHVDVPIVKSTAATPGRHLRFPQKPATRGDQFHPLENERLPVIPVAVVDNGIPVPVLNNLSKFAERISSYE